MSNPFKRILQTLLQTHTSLRAAIFCDDEGEMVDLAIASGYAIDEYDLRVAGATAAVWFHTSMRIHQCRTRDIFWSIKAENATWLLQGVAEKYYVLVLADPQAPTALVAHLLRQTARATRLEM